MIELLYLKLSKEEIQKSIHLYNRLNQNNIYNLLIYLQRSMLFMIDSINKQHTNLEFEFNNINKKNSEFLGKGFFEDYFFITNLLNKDMVFISKDKILIRGKKDVQSNRLLFKELIQKVINYFNKIYQGVEDNEL